MSTLTYRCDTCGSDRVQFLMPVWCHAESLDPIEVNAVDYEADPLSTWCEVCEDHEPVRVTDDGDEETSYTTEGRWALAKRGNVRGTVKDCIVCGEDVAPGEDFCAKCGEEFRNDLAAVEAANHAPAGDEPGSRCNAACGYCGRCGGA